MSWGDSPLAERIRYHATRVRAWARRATAPGLAVRGTVWFTGVAALLVAAPPAVNPGGMLLLALVLATLAAARPGGFWVGALGVGVVVAVAMAVGQQAASLLEVALVAALLYVHHTMAALAAQVRTDTLLPVAVLRRWMARTGLVLATSAVVGGGIAALPAAQPTWSASAFIGVGALAAVAVAAALAYLLLRRPDPA